MIASVLVLARAVLGAAVGLAQGLFGDQATPGAPATAGSGPSPGGADRVRLRENEEVLQ